jgi:hypothetical protein
VVVNYLREFQLAAGVPRDQLYISTMYVLCSMLVIGLICNLLVRPVRRGQFFITVAMAMPSTRRLARLNLRCLMFGVLDAWPPGSFKARVCDPDHARGR